MAGDKVDRYAFTVEWHESQSSLVRKFVLYYYVQDEMVEMFDLQHHKTFLRRSYCDTVKPSDLYIGNTVTVFARNLYIEGYADESTKNILKTLTERTFAMIKPEAIKHMGQIFKFIVDHSLKITRAKMVQFSEEGVMKFYAEHTGKPFFNNLISYMSSGPIIGLEILGKNAIKTWRTILGPTDSEKAKVEAPSSLRALFGTDVTRNAAHGSDSPESAAREILFFFRDAASTNRMYYRPSALLRNNTCCILKPSAFNRNILGDLIISIKDSGFDVTALEVFNLDHQTSADFLEVYKGVMPEYHSMVKELASGPCVVLEISSDVYGEETPVKFRELVGPHDPRVGKTLRPNSLRARFGKDKVDNAIHCSDLQQDGPLEVEYFFKILQPH